MSVAEQTIPANDSRRWHGGNACFVETTTAAVKVEFRLRKKIVEQHEDVEEGLLFVPQKNHGEPQAFDEIIVTAGGTSTTVKLRVSEGEVRSTRSAGTVDASITQGSTRSQSAVSVDTTAGGTQIFAANSARRAYVIHNAGAATLYLGASGLTTTDGVPVAPGASFPAHGAMLDAEAALFGITAAGSVDVRVMEVT